MSKATIQGTITALVTPFKKDGSIDFPALEKLIDFQIDSKIDGIVVCGSTGESATLSFKDKVAIIIRAVEYSAGRCKIIAGTGSNETEETLDLTQIAKEHGADAALIVAPYYNKPSQEGLFTHYKLIANSVDIPIIIYNVPGRTAVNISAEIQLKLARECSNIIATKEASSDFDQMMQIITNAPEGFCLLSGDDALALPSISVGAKGIVSVLSNYAPSQFKQCIDLALAGNFEAAKEIHYKLLDLMNLNFVESNPAPVKYALTAMGFIKEYYRMPMFPMKTANKKLLKAAMRKADIIK